MKRNNGSSGHRYPSRKRTLRSDDPATVWDEKRASKRDRIRDSPDAYLRPTKERLEKKRRATEE